MKIGLYKGRKVKLDKPIREIKGKKEFKVYTINPNTKNVVVVRFGDKNMRLNKQFKSRKESYCARSAGIKSSKPKKLQPNYWSRKRWGC